MTRIRSLATPAALLSASAAALLVGTPALAQGRPLTLVNSTANTMVRFYASAGRDGGGTDMLADRILKPGQSARITIDNGDGTCNFDLRAEFDNGSKQTRQVDICSVATYRFGG